MTSVTLSFLVVPLLLQTHLVAAQTSNFAAKLSGGYVTGTTPSELQATANFGTGIFIFGHIVTLQFGGAVLKPSTSPTVTLGGAAGSPVFTSGSDASGTQLVLTLQSGSIGSNEIITFYITSELAALPAAGPLSFTCSSTTDVAGTAIDVFYVIAAPVFTLATANYVVGTAPSSLRIQYVHPFDTQSGFTIIISANRAVFTSSVTTGLTPTLGYSTASYTTSVNGMSLQITLNNPTPAGASVDLTLGAALLATLPDDAGVVFLKVRSVQGATTHLVYGFSTGFGTILAGPPPPPGPPAPPPPLVVSGDPVTYYDDKKIEFVLPWDVFTPMLQTPHMDVLALPIPGKNEEEQWIGRIDIMSPTGDKAVQVDIKKNIDSFNRSAVPPDAFETIDVTLPWLHPKPLAQLPPRNIYHNRQGIDIVIRKLPNSPQAVRALQGRMPMLRREAVVVISHSAKIVITSSSAREWYGDNPDSNKFAHLDLEVFDMYNESSFGGILPELWGIKTPSLATQAMLKPMKSPESSPSFELV